jgi:hypothetical protein
MSNFIQTPSVNGRIFSAKEPGMQHIVSVVRRDSGQAADTEVIVADTPKVGDQLTVRLSDEDVRVIVTAISLDQPKMHGAQVIDRVDAREL